MADAARRGQGAERSDPAELDLAAAVAIPQDSGGVVIDFDGPQVAAPAEVLFSDNLANLDLGLFTEQQLNAIGHEVVQLVNEDERSRAEWKKTYANGLKLLGLQYEERTEPWAGACGAFHPMLLESVIRFNAQAMMDIFPGAGPVKTDIVGKITPEKERQAERVRTDMNYLATEKITGYRSETDMMLFNLPMAGTTFRKWGFDKQRRVPWAEYVLPEHVVMPYTASSLESSPRFTVILPTTRNKVESQMASGFYRTVKLGTPVAKTDEITKAKDKIDGRNNSNTVDDNLFRLYECHIDYYFAQDTNPGDALPHPYIITVDSTSNEVLAIRRNWKEGDAAFERQVSLVQHKYMPGFGPYGIGLINILGGLTESATSILRQLVDAGTLANLPAGYKTKTARVKDDSSPIGPGEWRDVEIGAGTLKEAFFPLPYGEPSTVLHALLGQIVDEGRRIGSVADMKITDMTGQNMPVGTTLAIIERSMKVMSAVQQRLYESFKNEFKVFAEIVKDFMAEEPYPFELDQRDAQATRATDYDAKVDIIPVADPNATTMAQRIMVMQAVIQLTQTAPQIYNLPNVHRDMITVLGSDKADFYIPPPEEVEPRDPVTENMDILNGRPVKAGIAQDHKAHIAVHMAAAQDPKIVQMLTNNPSAPAIMGAANAHVLEHLAFQYRVEIEEQLGVPLPPPGEPLPEDVEYQLSRLAAAAAEKLLDKNTVEAQQAKIKEQLEDPVIQNERESLRIKGMDAETKRAKVFGDLDAKEKDRQIEILLKIFEETSETDRAAISAQAQKDGMLDEKEIRMAELASELGQGVMGQLAQLLITRVKSDDSKAALAAKRTDA
jgi:hypothetical protein